MRKGSHNSLTYLPLKNWWMYPFNWIAKCQSKTYVEQYESGIRDFDLRIRFEDGSPIICHGLMKYKGGETILREFLDYLNEKGGCTVRLVLEVNKANIRQDEQFIDYIKFLNSHYTNITFWQFTRKFDWKILYPSSYDEEFYDQDVSSMKGCIWPWLYSKLFTKNSTTTKEILFLDFI